MPARNICKSACRQDHTELPRVLYGLRKVEPANRLAAIMPPRRSSASIAMADTAACGGALSLRSFDRFAGSVGFADHISGQCRIGGRPGGSEIRVPFIPQPALQRPQ